MNKPPSISIATHAEDLIARLLEQQGWHIIARNYRRRGCELDLVARKESTVAIIEVKARSRPLTSQEEWRMLLPPKKCRALRRGIERLMEDQDMSKPQTIRIDLAVVIRGNEGPANVQYISQAL